MKSRSFALPALYSCVVSLDRLPLSFNSCLGSISGCAEESRQRVLEARRVEKKQGRGREGVGSRGSRGSGEVGNRDRAESEEVERSDTVGVGVGRLRDSKRVGAEGTGNG
ncbi:hypothetical protein DFH09DRAFT_1112320 [Mycena vulgaris]|nr:hypothetical protein DFH09DRAFT_1112320 [Mycena vulgaris]